MQNPAVSANVICICLSGVRLSWFGDVLVGGLRSGRIGFCGDRRLGRGAIHNKNGERGPAGGTLRFFERWLHIILLF